MNYEKETSYAMFDSNGNFIGHPNKSFTRLFSNPTEEERKKYQNALKIEYTEEPVYDKEKQYAVSEIKLIDGKAIQVWAIHDVQPIDEVNEG